MGQSAAKALQDPSNESNLKGVFKSLDRDNSGSLTKNEWGKFCDVIFKDPTAYGFPELQEEKEKEKERDKEKEKEGEKGSGVEDVRKDWVYKSFTEADKNGDGAISFEEFRDFCMTHKKSDILPLEKKEKSKKDVKKELKEGTVIRILMMGDPEVGKTNLVLRLTDDTFSGKPIQGNNDFKLKSFEVDGQTVKLQIYDLYHSSKFFKTLPSADIF
jgi:hypothetical protein